MKLKYDSLIARADAPAAGHLTRMIAMVRSKGARQVVVRAKSKPGVTRNTITDCYDPSDEQAVVSAFGVQLADMTEVEVIGRGCLRKGQDQEHDANDLNALHWGGQRGSGIEVKPSLRGHPMFFRDNGTPLDLLDLYRGQACFLVLNGPSLKTLDLSQLRRPGIVTFGVNNGGHAFTPTFWTCVDDPQRFMRSIWLNPAICKFVPMAHFFKPTWDHRTGVDGPLVRDCPNVVGYRRNERFRTEQFLTEHTINWGNHGDLGGGRSCMLAALRILHLLGFARVYLVGCDFHMSAESKYFFEEERTAGAIKCNNDSYSKLISRFEALRPLFDEAQFQVLNCNPQSRLRAFEFASFDQAVLDCAIDTSDTAAGMYVDGKKGRRNDSLVSP